MFVTNATQVRDSDYYNMFESDDEDDTIVSSCSYYSCVVCLLDHWHVGAGIRVHI